MDDIANATQFPQGSAVCQLVEAEGEPLIVLPLQQRWASCKSESEMHSCRGTLPEPFEPASAGANCFVCAIAARVCYKYIWYF